MVISEDPWFSGILGRPVYRVESSEPSEIVKNIARHAATQSAATYFTKVNTARIDCVAQFIRAGMYVVDVNVTFAADPMQCEFAGIENKQVRVDEFTASQAEDILRI